MNRWSIAEAAPLLARELPRGLEDIWDAVPANYSIPADALASLRRSNQASIAQGLALIEQQAIASAGVSLGFRPEIFASISGLPSVDVIAETALLALEGQLDLSTLSDAAQAVFVDVIGRVGDATGASLALADYGQAVTQVVAIVWQTIKTIVQAEQRSRAADEAAVQASLDCVPPAYSAATDRALTKDAIASLRGPDWRNLFLPVARPRDPDYVPWMGGGEGDDGTHGFICCVSTLDGGRVIAPVGMGYGNRFQTVVPPVTYGDGYGYGLLPMCPALPVHRAIVVPKANYNLTYDPGEVLAQLAGLGTEVWSMLWGGGPAAFALDGKAIRFAWYEYLSILRDFIGNNRTGMGTHMAPEGRVCDSWAAKERQHALAWLFGRIGAVDPDRAADPDGIYMWDECAPVKAWRLFEDYQTALLERLVVAYVDPRTCAPEWRDRVLQAQIDLLTHPTAVCELDPDSIPNLDYRDAVQTRRKAKGASCYAVAANRIASRPTTPTDGPSLNPLDENAPAIPDMPPMARPARASGPPPRASTSTAKRGSSTTPLVLGAAGLAGVMALLRRR